MGKLMGVQQIQMYETMIREEFSPVLIKLEARGQTIKDSVVKDVLTEMGIYQLKAEIAALETRIEEVQARLTEKCGDTRYENGLYTKNSSVGIEIENRVEQLIEPLKEAREQRTLVIKNLRLCGAAEDLKTIFSSVETLVKEMAETVEALPPLKPVTEQISE